MMTTRATRGGQVGMNGEFYAGGTFLPSTQLGKMRPSGRRLGTGKQQIAPFVWEVAPAGMTSLFGKFGNFVDWSRGEVIEQACRYFGMTVEEVKGMKAKWEEGVRWV